MDNRQSNLFQIWFQAIRFPSLTAGLIPVMLGGAFAVIDRAFQSVPFLLALLGSMLLQAGTHLLNDYYDDLSGADRGEFVTGNAIQRGLLTPKQVYMAGLICFLLALLPGLYLVTKVGSGVLWFGLAGFILGYCYSGGPFPLAYRGFGEPAVFLAMGPLLVLATYFVQVGTIRWSVLLGSIPAGLLAAAILHTNNLRDREQDPSVGKITLANLLTENNAKLTLAGLLAAAYAIQAILVLFGVIPLLALLPLLTLPIAVRVIRRAWTSQTPLEINLVLGLTVLLQLLFGMAYALGLFASVLFM
ncbi:1,4-dihydroxy-2-naphthoate octaprenyltransferase [Effusibacillus lacus]|uniref:1,4-dihydroxy-2-naphthoate octaprenyltransferase n=1 Tax=Effusibacillus lacus TaxID=1348429 RepID=A0A292YFJ7_9BACL|nr:1,4-dihydroxy-2-naphthoate octaprenyltransferase [Effusibacillus lacus]TCS68576.1 1,4-dihydroxy-2-naphthoate prenyltransferase [Effusibacillus lacus]GAX88837.1 1,4-dihydroxy-2-naphthoate octaprenyltransferase [Effusibacillus lacus]